MSAIPSSFISNLKARVAFRTQLQNGKLPIPVELGEFSKVEVSLWKALWNAYLNNEGAISTPYWFDKFNDPRTFNQFIKRASDAGWIYSLVVPGRHWAEMSLVETKLLDYFDSKEDLIAIRRDDKFAKYRMVSDSTIRSGRKTRQNGVTHDTGLIRDGFAKSGTAAFKYDTVMLHKYYDAIVANTVKGMHKIAEIHTLIEDGADYTSISKDIIDFHRYSAEEQFTLGANYNDSRGRAISSSLARIFNPIGFKDARALLVQVPSVPVKVDEVAETKKAVYLFIAELLGIKEADSETHKAELGKQFYDERKLPELNLADENDRKDLHEHIWLERLYNELDALAIHLQSMNTEVYQWSVPIELDFGASMLGIEGALLNDRNLLTITNAIAGSITDPWKVDKLTRPMVKFAATPYLYGSSAPVRDLWTKNKIKGYTAEQVGIMNYELNSGKYALANQFKNLIIDNVQPQEHMTVTVWNDTFNITCNRYRRVGDYTKRYPIYSTDTGAVEAIAHTHTSSVPDLNQFRRFFATLLIHGIDSQIADYVSFNSEWCLTIHDAFVVSPVHALRTRRLATSQLELINKNRESIINNYFRSINMKRNALKEWSELMVNVTPVVDFKCAMTALK